VVILVEFLQYVHKCKEVKWALGQGGKWKAIKDSEQVERRYETQAQMF